MSVSSDDGILRPVEVDLAEPAAFGDECCQSGGWFVDDLCLAVGCDGVVEGVGGGDLVELRGFGYGLPVEGVDRVGVGRYAEDGRAVVVGGLGELDGLLVFDEADGPECDHGEESGDGPALSPEGRSARSYFAADEAEEGRGDESDQEDEKEDRFEDEDEGAGVPAGIEGKEGAEAVVVGPVEQEMTEQGDEGEAVEQTPADGGARWFAGGVLDGSCASGGRARLRLRRSRPRRAGRGRCGSIRDDAERQRWGRR